MDIIKIILALIVIAAIGGAIGLAAKRLIDSKNGEKIFYAAVGGALFMLMLFVLSKR